jgi:hypothetical protein
VTASWILLIVSESDTPRDAAITADVGGHALEPYGPRGAGLFGDLCLLWRHGVHDHGGLA